MLLVKASDICIHPGWALLDYLCVSARARNSGLGSVMLAKLAERRLGFYARNGLRLADYETEVFGVHYKTLYLAKGEVDERQLMAEHRFVYENSFAPDKFARYVRIPYDPNRAPGAKVAWEQ